jgi:hypothetical protein
MHMHILNYLGYTNVLLYHMQEQNKTKQKQKQLMCALVSISVMPVLQHTIGNVHVLKESIKQNEIYTQWCN